MISCFPAPAGVFSALAALSIITVCVDGLELEVCKTSCAPLRMLEAACPVLHHTAAPKLSEVVARPGGSEGQQGLPYRSTEPPATGFGKPVGKPR
jgi:hypothetical protein